MDTIGVFCNEDLSDYEKTMYSMAIAFSESGAYTIKREDIALLAAQLRLNDSLLYKALNFCQDGYIPHKQIKIGENLYSRDQFQNGDLFNVLVRLSFIYKNLAQLTDDTSKKAILNNYLLLQDSVCEFEILNMLTSTFECMSNDCYTLSYAVFNNAEYQPRRQLDLLHIALSKEFDAIFDKDFWPFLCRLMSYELITRVNAVYIITVNQIIKHSLFFKESIKAVANEMYCYLLGLAQNARVISMQTNYLHPRRADMPECRGKYDNTTRLQILYGYENFDTYYLRLDLAHKGQGFIHYNNKSPGGIKCCLFNEEEYLLICSRTPVASKFFIRYGERYALKEQHNICFEEDEFEQYETIRAQKEHKQAFSDIYDERTVLEFVNIIAAMLPESCNVCMDVEEVHARDCFQYEKIMFYSALLEICVLKRDDVRVRDTIESIAKLAIRYGIINDEEYDQYVSFDGVCVIIDEAKSRIALYQNM